MSSDAPPLRCFMSCVLLLGVEPHQLICLGVEPHQPRKFFCFGCHWWRLCGFVGRLGIFLFVACFSLQHPAHKGFWQ